MKKIFKMFVYYHLYMLVKLVLFFKKPFIVLVVGGENKSLLREKLKNFALSKKMDTYKKYRPYNTWFGITLAVLDLPSKYSDYIGWIGVYFLSFIKFFKALFIFPEYLFLDAGIDQTGEAQKFLNLLHPKVIVFGSIEHNFDDDMKLIDVIQKEYRVLASYINKKSDGYSKIQQAGTIEDVVELIASKERFFCAFNKKYPRLMDISSKITRKIEF